MRVSESEKTAVNGREGEREQSSVKGQQGRESSQWSLRSSDLWKLIRNRLFSLFREVVLRDEEDGEQRLHAVVREALAELVSEDEGGRRRVAAGKDHEIFHKSNLFRKYIFRLKHRGESQE